MGSEPVSETNPAAASSSSLPAVILPDHSTFKSEAALGYKGVGPTICLEIKPKWGLDPRCQSKSTNPSGDDNGRDELPFAGKPPSGEFSENIVTAEQPERLLVGPNAYTDELCPTGDDGACSPGRLRQLKEAGGEASRSCGQRMLDGETFFNGNGSLDFRRHFPRFMLHMLYKHVKHGMPISLYNPLDLFSGELERMEAALRSLIKSPSNNLIVFRDGIRIYGATNVKAVNGGDEAHQKHEGVAVASLERLALELQGFFEVGTAEVHQGDNDSDLVGPGIDLTALNAAANNPQAAEATALIMSVAETASTGATTATIALAAAIEMAVSLPGAAEVAAAQSDTLHIPEDASVGAGSISASASAGGIAVAIGVECLGGGALMFGGAASASAPASFGNSCSGATVPETDTARRTSSERPCDSKPLMAALDSLARLTALALHKEGLMGRLQQVQALDGVGPEGALRLYNQLVQELQAAEALSGANNGGNGSTTAANAETLAALRHYLMSATAKDCGIMVTLQRAIAVTEGFSDGGGGSGGSIYDITNRFEPELSGQQQPAVYSGTGISSDHVAVQEGHLHHHHHQLLMLLQKQQRPCVRVLVDPLSGATYMYKVALVDLDVKAASKIPKHVELEQSLVACAEENRELLCSMARQTGWMSKDS
ncbi:hypothetical protein Vretimale_9149 [Volvox reticuliferus]|nr:hypothetical protein Vretimale_9149 [Volvox reticuliferus]